MGYGVLWTCGIAIIDPGEVPPTWELEAQNRDSIGNHDTSVQQDVLCTNLGDPNQFGRYLVGLMMGTSIRWGFHNSPG